MKALGYKLARPDGWDFYTGKTINYRGDGKYPHIVKVPNPQPGRGLCSNGVGHASANINDCFVGAKIPCSVFRLSFIPVCGDAKKWGWVEAKVLDEIEPTDALFGWQYTEACHPILPVSLPLCHPLPEDLKLLERWDSVWVSVRDSVRAPVWDSFRDLVWASVRDSVGVSVGDSVWASVWAAVTAYMGSLFLHENDYPFQPVVDLWYKGLVPTFDGAIWRLYSGPKAEVVWQGKIGK